MWKLVVKSGVEKMYPELKDFKDEVFSVIGSLDKVDADIGKKLYQENQEMRTIIEKHYLKWKIGKDDIV